MAPRNLFPGKGYDKAGGNGNSVSYPGSGMSGDFASPNDSTPAVTGKAEAKSKPFSAFETAFLNARKGGMKEFDFRGKRYTTKLKSEMLLSDTQPSKGERAVGSDTRYLPYPGPEGGPEGTKPGLAPGQTPPMTNPPVAQGDTALGQDYADRGPPIQTAGIAPPRSGVPNGPWTPNGAPPNVDPATPTAQDVNEERQAYPTGAAPTPGIRSDRLAGEASGAPAPRPGADAPLSAVGAPPPYGPGTNYLSGVAGAAPAPPDEAPGGVSTGPGDPGFDAAIARMHQVLGTGGAPEVPMAGGLPPPAAGGGQAAPQPGGGVDWPALARYFYELGRRNTTTATVGPR
jgi:hypothetical protein